MNHKAAMYGNLDEAGKLPYKPQQPEAGTTIEQPSPLVVRIKKGKRTFLMPSLKQTTEQEAKITALEQDNKKLRQSLSRTNQAFNNLAKQVNDLKVELKNKVNRYGM